MINVIEKSYAKHKRHLNSFISKDKKFDYDWLYKTTYDTWRQKRLYGLVDSLVRKKDSWVTIGDGRYGSDAHYLLEKGVTNILATDISDKLLRIAKKDKYIPKSKIINAESINLADNSYDYLLCKESFHHFPRPMVALYEMIRVARKGVVLIEPNDTKALKNNKYANNFETVGNYVYSISLREIEKITNAVNLPCFAYKGIDDIYVPGGECIPRDSIGINILKAKLTLLVMEILSKLKIRERSVICLVIFKTNPQKIFFDKLIKEGFRFIINQSNPKINVSKFCSSSGL
jgi:ubiquinone/menaquinone biosynthesis C-methylase UbiE